ncbi:MAG TPA: hypothetical protein VHZ95_14145 [Polyangiales bacterium]|nr:hypothetical protein [Polyangiales bacterium]
MLAAHVVGVSLIRVATASRKGPGLQRKKLEALLTVALAACVAPVAH